MDSIVQYVNEFGAYISSICEGFNYDASAEIFYGLVVIGFNMVSAFGVILAFALPFLVIYWCIKLIGGAF